MRIPPKPKRGKRSPYYWWRRWKSHQYLPVKEGLLARIQNGDFEYPELFKWAEYELHYMKEEHDAYKLEYKGWGDIKFTEQWIDIERRYRKRYSKLFNDAHEVEHRHLTNLVDALIKEFIITREEVKTIMEEFGETTESLYIHVGNNYDFKKPTKEKAIHLLKTRI